MQSWKEGGRYKSMNNVYAVNGVKSSRSSFGSYVHLFGHMQGNYSVFTTVTVDSTHFVLWVGQKVGQEH